MSITKFLTITTWIGFTITGVFIGVVAYWLVYPYNVVTLKQPIQVLNENGVARIGEPLILSIDYNKNIPIPATVYQSITCESGNLIPLVSFTNNIPEGNNEFIYQDILIPPKIQVGDVCIYHQRAEYRVNPIRVVSYDFISEKFTIGESIE